MENDQIRAAYCRRIRSRTLDRPGILWLAQSQARKDHTQKNFVLMHKDKIKLLITRHRVSGKIWELGSDKLWDEYPDIEVEVDVEVEFEDGVPVVDWHSAKIARDCPNYDEHQNQIPGYLFTVGQEIELTAEEFQELEEAVQERYGDPYEYDPYE